MSHNARLNACVSCLFVSMLALSCFAAVAVVWQLKAHVDVGYCVSANDLPPMNLTVVGINGTQCQLDATDVESLPSYEAWGGWKTSLGSIRGLGNYTGVPLTVLCDLVGGISLDQCLLITASDNYSMVYSYEQVLGDFPTYDPQTGNPVNHSQPLTAMLAYFRNDTALPPDEGPLRVAIVGPEGLVTDGKYWTKFVCRLEVRWLDDVAITSVTLSKTVVAQTCTPCFNVTAENQGGYTETFSISLYANNSVVDNISGIVLANGSSTTVTFVWNTTGYAHGKYIISAKASTVSYEIDLADNTCEGGIVTVTIQGDVDGDFDVDILDVVKVTSIYGTKRGDATFSANSDLDDDGVISILDVVRCTSHYGEKSP